MPRLLQRFPVIERELRIRSRQWTSYWSRVGTGMLAVGFGGLSFVAESAVNTGKAGRPSFAMLGIGVALVVMATAIRLAAQAFAREKREDTLGLLLLTPLRPLELVLSKLVSTALPAFYQFVTVIPVLAIPILAGGVSIEDFALLVIGLANLAFFTTTVGLYFSTIHWEEKRATVASVFALALGFILFPPMFGGLLQPVFLSLSGREIPLYTFSPGFPIWEAVVQRSGAMPEVYASLIWTHLLGWLFIRITCRALPTCCHKNPITATDDAGGELHWVEEVPQMPGESVSQEPSQVRVVTQGSGVRRVFSAGERARLLEHNAALWLAMRWRPSPTRAMLVGGLGFFVIVVVLVSEHLEGFVHPWVVLVICWFFNAGFKSYVAIHASQALLRRDEEDPLDILLSTPVKARELVEAQVLSIRQPLVHKVKVLLACEVGWLILSFAVHALQDPSSILLPCLAAVGMLGMFVPDLYATGLYGLWQGVISRNRRDAEAATLRILVLPWLCTLPFGFLGALTSSADGFILLTTIGWILSSVMVNRRFRSTAEANLEGNMYPWALSRASGNGEYHGNWVRLGRALGRWWGSRSQG